MEAWHIHFKNTRFGQTQFTTADDPVFTFELISDRQNKTARSQRPRAVFENEIVYLLHLGTFEETLQVADARGMAELAQRLRFDLANTFAGNVVHLANFFERALVAVG